MQYVLTTVFQCSDAEEINDMCIRVLYHMNSPQLAATASQHCKVGASMHNVLIRLNWYDREQLEDYKLRVPGYRRLWEWNSPVTRNASDFACNCQGGIC